ncbi:Deoxyuridine 5'-triphosphate nucleotidohydrolase [uncultured Ruminococcus sp.]|uniref:dUTP diphosphatase n=1 Tax=Hominimerdicola aceti TaxID=2981726 RepID=A0AAE3LN87_9FIRM|nr:dUTP pyrophosphatase [Hominimerdicola aceti]MCU6706471.1 dUTP pyrophosphatase [Hominimerdicola aceti]SCJ07690.1 Deoxyuridine 5'-triphosphate nucleotidohydrolase [uncultured Ruminococcus sp.]
MITAVKFAKIKPNAIIPTKRPEDAGYDVYPCFDEDYIIIKPHTTVIIPTGIASACDTDYCFVLHERSSTGTKGMAQRCGIIDSGYRGEWGVPITNTNDVPIVICKKESITDFNDFASVLLLPYGKSDSILYPSDYILYPYEKAICQALIIPVPEVEIEEYTYEELKAISSERGTGRLGSSGK